MKSSGAKRQGMVPIPCSLRELLPLLQPTARLYNPHDDQARSAVETYKVSCSKELLSFHIQNPNLFKMNCAEHPTPCTDVEAFGFTFEEQQRFDKLQKIYDKRQKDCLKYENTFTFDLIVNGLAPTYEEVRLQRQRRAEEEFQRRISQLEGGEIVDMVIETADYRFFRCVFGEHLVPKERVVELQQY
jgi:hypothetical protein